MAVVLSLRWPGVTPGQYDEVRDAVGWEEQAPDGAYIHVAWFEPGALRVTDVWESQGHFERFRDAQLMAAVVKAGITTEPEAEYQTLHRRFVAPGVTGAD
ncbi:hypothetical protein [Yinghuangia seranimata]|uniref:hypothetical protein n=1 Tax=Yinghuangia seranimata TaxID=408067 RepID=UPI00248B1B7C|nr:hypothetical protein [Yinghuangia seranimata]MDI2132733.1 hypothetical protein [Yinghuangia seranimata]